MEKTLITPMPLDGRDWLFFPDLNLLGVSDRLSAGEHQRCMDELQAEWRRSMIHLVKTG